MTAVIGAGYIYESMVILKCVTPFLHVKEAGARVDTREEGAG